MNESQLQELLTGADRAFAADSRADPASLALSVQRRVVIRKKRRNKLLAGGIVVLLVAGFLLGYPQYNRYREKKQIALQMEIQNELAALKAETEQTLALIQSVNQRTERRKQLAALQQRLASLAAEAAEPESQDEQLAGQLYQKAQSLSAQADSCNAVKALYQQIIRTFPDSSYTNQAKQELSQLECLNGTHL